MKMLHILTLLVLALGIPFKKVGNKDYAKQHRTSSTSFIVLIRFGKNDVSFNWDNSKSRIVEDKLLENQVHQFENNKLYLANQITNIAITKATACGKADKLVVGDLAFLLIEKIRGLPFFEITHVQCDSFEIGCNYPVGYFEVLKNKRIEISKRVKRYLSR